MGRGKSENPPGPRLVGYARVSTEDQSLALQTDALLRAGVLEGNLYVEKRSGSSVRKRVELQKALMDCREGDTLVIWRIDRLTRNMPDLYWVLSELQRKVVGLRSITEHIDTNTASGRLAMNMATSFAQYERESIGERTKAGLAVIKKMRGKGWKWVPKRIMTEAKVARAGRLLSSGTSGPAVAKMLGVSTASIYGKWRWSKSKSKWVRKTPNK